MRPTNITILFVTIISLVEQTSATGWNSECRARDGGRCTDGPGATHGRIGGNANPDSEHAALMRDALGASGLPSTLGADFFLPTYTSGRGAGAFPSRRPTAVGARYTLTTTVSIPMMAEVPDFSFSLAGFAVGNETCSPSVESLSLEACYGAYRGELRLLNSTHFGPQARVAYIYYHRLAESIGASCRSLSDALPTNCCRSR